MPPKRLELAPSSSKRIGITTGEPSSGQASVRHPVQSEALAKRRRTKPVSSVWDEFLKREDGTSCVHCGTKLNDSQGKQTTAAETHLLFCQRFEKANSDVLRELVMKHKGGNTSVTRTKTVFNRVEHLLETYSEKWKGCADSRQSKLHKGDSCTRSRKDEIDKKLMAMFYEEGLSFRLIESPGLQQVIQTLNTSYPIQRGLTRKQIGSLKHIEEYYEATMKRVHAEIKNWPTITVACDGWKSISGRSILNICMVGLQGSAFLVASIDMSSKRCTAENLTAAVKPYLMQRGECFEENGVSKIVGCCSDNASAYRKTRESFAQLGFGSENCHFHVIDLVASKFFKSSPMIELLCMVVNWVCDFINMRPWVNAAGQELNKAMPFKRIVTMSSTRKMSQTRVMARLLYSRAAISFLFNSRSERFANSSKEVKEEAERIRTMTATDEFEQDIQGKTIKFWKVLWEIVQITRGLEHVQRLYESSACSRSTCYMHLMHLEQFVKKKKINETELKKDFLSCLGNEREKYMKRDLISVFLDPRRSETIERKGLKRKVDTVFRDYMLWADAIDQVVQLGLSLRESESSYKIFSDAHCLGQAVRKQAHELDNDMQQLVVDRKFDSGLHVHPLNWWLRYGKEMYPLLYPIARITIGLSVTSSGVERVNSMYLNVHSKNRNRLHQRKAFLLSAIYVNSRELRTQKPPLPATESFSEIEQQWLRFAEDLEADLEESALRDTDLDVEEYLDFEGDYEKTEVAEYEKVEYDEEQSPESSDIISQDISQEISDVLNDL